MQIILTFISIFFGWMLGIAQNLIIDRIRNRKQVRELLEATYLELEQYRYKMAISVCRIRFKAGDISQELISWIQPIAASYNGPDKNSQLTEHLEKLAKVDSDKILERAKYKASMTDDLQSLSLRCYGMPFLKAQINRLSLCPIRIQTRLLEILQSSELVNQIIEQHWFFYQKTFDGSLSEANHKHICNNMDLAIENIAMQGTLIVDRISEVLAVLRQPKEQVPHPEP